MQKDIFTSLVKPLIWKDCIIQANKWRSLLGNISIVFDDKGLIIVRNLCSNTILSAKLMIF